MFRGGVFLLDSGRSPGSACSCLIFAISTHCGCLFLIQVFSPIMDAGEVREETKSNECEELLECFMHILLLQECLAAFLSLLVG